MRVNRLLCAFPLIWQCSVNEENLFNLQGYLLKETLRKCSPASGVGLRRGVEKSNRMNNVYLPLSCILSASLESWSGSLLCLITPSGVTETSQSEYWSGVAVTANSRMAWTTTSFAVVSLLIMMYRLCWSALKTLSTWSGKSGGKESHVSVGRISVHGDKIKQSHVKKVLRKDDAELPSLPYINNSSSKIDSVNIQAHWMNTFAPG